MSALNVFKAVDFSKSSERMMPLSLLAAVAETSESDDDSLGSSNNTTHHRGESSQSLKGRLARKAELARESRRRKKCYIQGLEEQIVMLKQKVQELHTALCNQSDDVSVLSAGSINSTTMQTMSIHDDTSLTSQKTSVDSPLSVKLHYNNEIRRISLIKSHVSLISLREKAVAYWPQIGCAAVVSVMKNGAKASLADEEQLTESINSSNDKLFSVYLDKSVLNESRAVSPCGSPKRSEEAIVKASPPCKRARSDSPHDSLHVSEPCPLVPATSSVVPLSHPIALRCVSPMFSLTIQLQVVENIPNQGAVVALSHSLSLARDSTFVAVRQCVEQSLGTPLQDFVFLVSGAMMLPHLESQLVASLMQPQQVLMLCRRSLISPPAHTQLQSAAECDQ